MTVVRTELPGRGVSYLAHSDDGSSPPIGGAGTDRDGKWTWWARCTQGRRIIVANEHEAAMALYALEGAR